ASLTGLLVLAEVNSSQAVLATLTYRIASYWLPLLAGPVAYGLFKFRYRDREKPEADLRRAAGQVEQVVEDAVEGADGHRELTVARGPGHGGARGVGGEPFPVRERDHRGLVGLPDGGGGGGGRCG